MVQHIREYGGILRRDIGRVKIRDNRMSINRGMTYLT